MAIDLVWWPGGTVLDLRCDGVVRGDELVAANHDILADPRLPGLSCQLCDMMAVEDFTITRAQVEAIIECDLRAEKIAGEMDRFAVACDKDFIFGFARMYEIILGGRTTRVTANVVRSREEALEWLGVEDVKDWGRFPPCGQRPPRSYPAGPATPASDQSMNSRMSWFEVSRSSARRYIMCPLR